MRSQILEIAQDQMKVGGYDELNFALIAKELDTTRANLHYHFKNKETLAIEVTKRFIADQEAFLKKIAAQFNGDLPSILSLMEKYLWEHHKENGCVSACVCSQIIRQPGVPNSLSALAKQHFLFAGQFFEEQVLESQKSGVLRDDVDAKKIALEAKCVLFGLSQIALFSDDKDFKELEGTLKNWVKNYIK